MSCWAPHDHGDDTAEAQGLLARFPDVGAIITRLWRRHRAYSIEIRMDQWAAVHVECDGNSEAPTRIILDIECDTPHLGLAEALRRLDDADFTVSAAQRP